MWILGNYADPHCRILSDAMSDAFIQTCSEDLHVTYNNTRNRNFYKINKYLNNIESRSDLSYYLYAFRQVTSRVTSSFELSIKICMPVLNFALKILNFPKIFPS